MKYLFYSSLNLTTRLRRGCHFTTRQQTGSEIQESVITVIILMIVSVRLISVIGFAASHILSVKIEIKLSKLIDRILVKVQSRTKSTMGLPVIIFVVALLVVVLRFVVVFLVIGLLK